MNQWREKKSRGFVGVGFVAALTFACVQEGSTTASPAPFFTEDSGPNLTMNNQGPPTSHNANDAGLNNAQPTDAGSPPDEPPGTEDEFTCAGFMGGEPQLCAQTEEACHIVFRNGSGCVAACASANLVCLASMRDDDDNESHCAPHPTDSTPYGCEETGHRSDYCVCGSECEPLCDGRACGPDGCGGTCGTCSDEQMCEDGQCQAIPPPPPFECRNDNPTFNGTVNVNETIVIDTPGVHDYQNVLHRWTGGGVCNQTENQPYILRIAASNVTLRNFAYSGAPDGIHIGTSASGQGHSSGRSLSNIVLENVTGEACEDALTIQYGVQDVSIRNSLFLPNPNPEFRDKLLQLNFGDVHIERTTFFGGDLSTCVMFKGGQNIHIQDSCFNDCDRAINGSTIHGIIGRISNDRSDLLSERNEGRFPDRARIFWDRWNFFTGSGDVHMISVDDMIYDNARADMDQGASLTVR